MRVLLAHPGTQHARRTASELERHALLGEFWTGLAWSETGSWATVVNRFARLSWLKGQSNRIARGLPASRLHCQPTNELFAIGRLKLGHDSMRVLHERNRRFQEAIPVGSLRACDAVIAFDTSAWRLVERTNAVDRPLFLERTIAHPSAFAPFEAELRRRHPAWCSDAIGRPGYLTSAEAIEHSESHRVVLGSSFARDTLLAHGVDPGKLRINPYGVDWVEFESPPAQQHDRPLRFLFLGAHVARKGLPDLLQAWHAIGTARGEAELWLAGPCGDRERRLIPEMPGLRIIGPVPHVGVPALLAQCDVLVLPSHFEGFSLTLLEALSAGLPLVTTPNSGSADLLQSPVLGRSVAPGSIEELRAAIEMYLAHPPDRESVRAEFAPLREYYSWRAYGDRWSSLLHETI